MPELPEVETIVRSLRGRVRGLEFSRVSVYLGKCVRGSTRSFVDSVRGRKILGVERRGKNMVFNLSGGVALLIHLGMSGRLRLVPGPAPLEKHTQVIFSFQDHPRQLRFVDPRQFGRLGWEKRKEGRLASLSRLGPEPLEVSLSDFARRLSTRHRQIKPLLLDQAFLAGVGNIYADESLHRAGIHPRRRSDSLGRKSLSRLYQALQEVLLESIQARGTSVRSYMDSDGSPGSFQNSLRVYGREGKPCPVCRSPIVREWVGGRSSFFCPRCQRGPRMKVGKGGTFPAPCGPGGKRVA
jgi:formamidopyrimidine-DNA glycosylase